MHGNSLFRNIRFGFAICALNLYLQLFCTADGFEFTGNPSDIGNSQERQADHPDTAVSSEGQLIIDMKKGIFTIENDDDPEEFYEK